MNMRSRIIVGLCFAAALAFPALADLNYTEGDGVTRNKVLFDFTCFTTKHCSAHVPIKSDGTEIFTSSNPAQVTGANGTFPASQSGAWTVQPGNTANTTAWLMNVGAINGVTPLMGNGATGTGSQRVTIANDNTIPTGWPTAANQTAASAARGQGATGASVPSGAQYIGINSGGNLTGWNGAVTNAGTFAAQVNGFTSWAGSTLGAMANYGTSPGAVLVPGVNAFITNTNANGGASVANSSPVVPANQYSAYETIAASQTAQAMGATGATGDYLSHCVIYPVTTSPGVVTVFDNTNAASTNAIAFAGGATSVSNLAPIAIPVGAFSTAGAWKVTTGANVIVTCYGKFT
jgi:hypothetical protein